MYSHPVSCLAWGITALAPTGCWVGPGLGTNELEGGSHYDDHPHQCPCGRKLPLWVATSVCVPKVSGSHPTSPGDSPRPAGRSAQAPIRLLLLPWVLVHVRFCVHPLIVKSLFPPVLWNSQNWSPLAFRTECCGDLSSWCRVPRLGSPTWGSERSFLWKNLCNIIIFQFMGHPSRGMQLDYITTTPLLPVLLPFLLYVFSCRSFLVGSDLFHTWSFCR